MGKRITPDAAADCTVTLEIAGRTWRLRKPAKLDDIWDSLDERAVADERLPYWVEVWPSSVALVQWLHANASDISGCLCLDLGCGLGLSAIAGQFWGARVLAADYEIEALECVRANCLLNGVTLSGLLAMDWRYPPLARNSISRIWASDIIYEKRFIKHLVRLFGNVLAQDGKIWLADPGRNIFPFFLEALQGAAFEASLAKVLVVEQACASSVHANIWEISRL